MGPSPGVTRVYTRFYLLGSLHKHVTVISTFWRNSLLPRHNRHKKHGQILQ